MEKMAPQEKIPTPVRRFVQAHEQWKAEFEELKGLIKAIRVAHREGKQDEVHRWKPPAELMAMFYARAKRAYEEIPFTKEQIAHFFSPDYLAHTTVEEYVDLLKKVPPRMTTHVVRQGIRDHASHHMAGLGSFHHGFEGVLDAGELRSTIEQALLGEVTRETVGRLLHACHIPEQFQTKEEAQQRIVELLEDNVWTSPRALTEFTDGRALHAALDVVSDEYYGGESGNEIFIVYPTAFVASQCYLASQSGIPKAFRPTEGDSKQWNDLWILAKEGVAGRLPLDASLTFIPEDADVDPNTGSRYDTAQDGSPIENQDQMEAVLAFFKQHSEEDREEFFRHAFSYWNTKRDEQRLETKIGQFSRSEFEEKRAISIAAQQKHRSYVDNVLNQLRTSGVRDERFFAVFDDAEQARTISVVRDWISVACSGDEDAMQYTKQRLPFMYKLASQTISSRQFWEARFQQQGKQPAKVVWYSSAQTPTEALLSFLHEKGIVEPYADERHANVDLKEMFKEHIVEQQGMHDLQSRERELIITMADEILEEWYGSSS